MTGALPTAKPAGFASSQSTAVLQVEDLQISLPKGADRALAVDGASFSIEAGETLCVVGESGSGKSMIANAVMGLLPRPLVEPVGGRVLLDGVDILGMAEERMRELRGYKIGMVFQEPMTALNPVMRIGDQVGEVLDAHGIHTAQDKRRRVLEALADVGLPEPEHLINTYPFRLSGGQRQRVMIACALIQQPRLLICDEPTTALDVTTQANILRLIRALQARRGMAVLFITHDFGVVSEIADQVVVMQTGKLVEAGSARRLLRAPSHPYTRKLIDAIPNGGARAARDLSNEPRVLQVENLDKTYETRGGLFRRVRQISAAKNVSFDLRRGETLGVVGESGSGKSSIGRCLVGLDSFQAGHIRFNGLDVSVRSNHRGELRGKLQMVFQDPFASLNPRQSVGAAIMAGPRARGVPAQHARARMLELLGLVGLSESAANRYPHEFSGGQRQRIGIARALAMDPELLVADEPVSALDVSVQAQVLELFDQVRTRFQLSMVFITHDLRVAERMCDRIAVMQQGSLVEYGLTQDVLSNPKHPYTRCLVEAKPKLL